MKKLLCTASILSAVLAISPIAQSMEVYNDEKNALNFSGNLSVYYLNAEEFDEINDGFSRFVFDYTNKLKYDWQGVAKVAWGVQLSSTGDSIFVGNNGLTSTGPTSDVIWLRQGFVGVQHEKYGRITLGKQWGVSYDIGGVTDVFEVFGADAQGTYNFGTDGGFSGTGRAEEAMQYKVNYQNFSFGLQYLPADQKVPSSDETANREIAFNDSFGLSIIYKAPYDIGLGLAYNSAELSLHDSLQNIVKAEDELITAHITYRSFANEGLHVAFVYTDMSNHDINDVGKLMNKSTGMELFSEYRFDNDFSLILGYNSLEDNSTIDLGSNGNYHLQYFILSAKYNWDDDFYIYLESKVDDSTLSNNSKAFAEDATAIGMMYTF